MLTFVMVNISVIKDCVEMEFDRYSSHHHIFILGIICLFMGICCLAFAIFLIPYTLFQIDYSLPLIFFQASDAIERYFSITDVSAQSGMIYIIIFIGLLLLIIAEIISNYIDNQLFKVRKIGVSEEVRRARSESWHTTLVVLLVIFLAIIGLKLFQWTISSS